MTDFTSTYYFIFWFCIYFFPSGIATSYKHKAVTPITLVNLFLGWTFIGWVVCLAWASNGNIEKKEEKS